MGAFWQKSAMILRETRGELCKHRLSESLSGPVDTGFRYVVSSPLDALLVALQRIEATMVLPTSVLAP